MLAGAAHLNPSPPLPAAAAAAARCVGWAHETRGEGAMLVSTLLSMHTNASREYKLPYLRCSVTLTSCLPACRRSRKPRAKCPRAALVGASTVECMGVLPLLRSRNSP